MNDHFRAGFEKLAIKHSTLYRAANKAALQAKELLHKGNSTGYLSPSDLAKLNKRSDQAVSLMSGARKRQLKELATEGVHSAPKKVQ